MVRLSGLFCTIYVLVVAKSMFHLKRPDIAIFVRPFDLSTAEVPRQSQTTHKPNNKELVLFGTKMQKLVMSVP